MLYFASFFCPSHTEQDKYFDENRKKPCLGKCGHTICLSCVENSVNCPICNKEDAFVDRTINYGAIEIIRDCRSNILNVFKSWWAGEKYGSGLCSKCFEQTDLLRLCIFCNSDMCSIDEDGDVKLFLIFRMDFLKLSQCVICADCALEHHDHPKEQDDFQVIEKIEDIKIDSYARKMKRKKLYEEVLKVSSKANAKDENRKKPCLGKCGHTICLACVENSVHCPICNKEDAFIDRTINYGAMEIIRDCRSDILNVAKSWWAGEKYGSGQCSKCFVQTDLLRLCVRCNGDMCCKNDDGDFKLCVIFQEDLIKLSQCVVCADCALEHHDHPEEQEKFQMIEKVQEIKIDSYARKITFDIIMDLLKDEVKNGNLRLNCKLRFMKLHRATYVFSMVSEELDRFEEDCGYLGELIKSQLANKYIENTWKEIDQAFNGPVCECTRLYEELLKVTGKRLAKRKYICMSMEGVEEFAMGCSLDFKENAKLRDEIYTDYLKETAPDVDYTKAIYTESGCELCIYYDYFDEETRQNTEYHQNRCMELYKNFWKSELPSIESLCFRCLSCLHSNLVGRCCKQVKKQWQFDRIGLNVKALIEHQRRYGARRMDSDVCKLEEECVLADKKFWKYAVKLEIREKAYKIFKEQIEEGIADDQTRLKLLETLEIMDHSIGEIDLREDTKEELLVKVTRIDEVLEELKIQWENFKCHMEE